jgi:hypothetical protein
MMRVKLKQPEALSLLEVNPRPGRTTVALGFRVSVPSHRINQPA